MRDAKKECACGCGRELTVKDDPAVRGHAVPRYTPECLARKKNERRRLVGKAEREARRSQPRPAPRQFICKRCYGLARERGMACACLEREAMAS